MTTDIIFKIFMMRYLALSGLDRYKYTVELHLSGSWLSGSAWSFG